MGIRFYFHDVQKEIAVIEFSQPWTFEQLYTIETLQSTPGVQSQPHEVMLILDFTHSEGVPMSGNFIGHSRALFSKMPDNVYGMVVVTRSAIIEAMLNMIKSVLIIPIFGKTMVTGTLQEAIDLHYARMRH
jgi:hypothetical protein